ncbi:MAG: ABC transporter permease subunit [Actinobacteria bacterium]|nr:ABC transporter permease subunit [Actinomycetota bacterium]
MKTDGGAARQRAALLLLAVLLAVLIGYPLVELLRAAFERGWSAFADGLRGGTAGAVWNTVWTGAAAAAASLALGTAAALVTERSAPGRRRWLRLGMLLPVLIPPFVSALGWAEAYGPAGLLDDLLGVDLPGLFGPAGVAAVITVNTVPLAYLVVAAGLASAAEPDLERAARASGATALQAFRTVTLPLLRPSLVSAGGLVFVVAVNSFGVPVLLGTPAGFETMTTRIYRNLALSADPDGFVAVVAVAAALVAITFLVVAVSDAWSWLGGAVVRPGAPAGIAPAGLRSRTPAVLVGAYAAMTSAVPLAALVLRALTKAVGLAPWPSNWTFANFAEALDGAGGAFVNSLLLAAAAATAAVVLGGAVAALGRGRRGWLGSLPVLSFAVPGSALAVAVLLAYGRPLRDSLLLILVAYLAKFWALGHRPIAGSVENLPPDLVRAARASGAGPWSALRTVVLPLLRPAVAAAWLLVFLFAFHELTMSALLYGPGSETLAVVILNLRQIGDVSVTAAMAVLLTLVVLAAGGALALARRPERVR